jgi:putative endonuclease
MDFWVYILYSSGLNRFYIGSTGDLEGRLRRHNTNHRGYSGKANDWVIVHQERFIEKSAAQVREKQINSWKSRKLLLALIKKGSEHPATGGRATGSNPVTPT